MTDEDLPRMVAGKDIYAATAEWGERAETAEALAARWIALIARLEQIDPAFTGWMSWGTDDVSRVPFDPTLEAQVARVLSGTPRHVTGRLAPDAGSKLGNLTDPDKPSQCFKINMGAGPYGPYSHNYVSIGSDYFAVPEPRLVAYQVFHDVLLALAETFEATQAYAWTSDLLTLWPKERDFDAIPLAWMAYVAPRFAHLVTPPPNVVVERRPDGGLLIAATDGTFATANPVHFAAAQEIQQALGPFNAVPWTLEAGK